LEGLIPNIAIVKGAMRDGKHHSFHIEPFAG